MAPSMADLVSGLLELTRPVNATAAAVLTFVGAFVASGAAIDPLPVTVAMVATTLATGGGNAINDYFDREVDRVNDPDRPIPRGDVPPRLALGFSLVLFGLALALVVAVLPVLAIAIALLNLAALIAYTPLFKGTPGGGNAVVAYLGGSTFLFGGAAVGDPGAAVVLAALAALATLTREIIKDVEDIAGDREEGLETLPVVVGERRALVVGAALLGVAVLASPLPFVLGTLGVVYLGLVVPADAVMCYAAYRGFSDPAAGQSVLKYGMFLAAVAFVLGRAATVGGVP